MEFGLSSLKREPFDVDTNEESCKLDLDFLNEVREDAL